MGLTALSGPFLSYGITQGSTGQVQEYNDQRGPSLFDLGFGTADPRYQYSYKPGNPVTTQINAFFGNAAYVDFVPITAQTSAFAISSNTTPVAGTAVTLSAASSALGTYATTIVAPETGQATASLLAIDSTAQFLTFGQSGTVAIWNPAAGAGRTFQLTMSSTIPDVGSVTVAGRDVYGFKMTETIPFGSTSVSTYAGQKAFKYITGVTPSSSCTINSTGWGLGYTDTFGMPLLTKYTGQDTVTRIVNVSSLQYPNSSGAITLGTTVATNLVSTGIDVRGTYASTTASNGTIRLQIRQNITAAMVNSVTASDVTALFGGTQYSSV